MARSWAAIVKDSIKKAETKDATVQSEAAAAGIKEVLSYRYLPLVSARPLSPQNVIRQPVYQSVRVARTLEERWKTAQEIFDKEVAFSGNRQRAMYMRRSVFVPWEAGTW
jgi:hypothetical protein